MPKSSDIFFPTASFNKTITPDRRSKKYQNYAEVFWKYGDLLSKDQTVGNILNIATKDYSVPIYDIKEANTTIKVYQLSAYQKMYSISNTGVPYGAEIPFNLNWKAGTGNDRLMIIADYETGTMIELSGVLFGQPWNVFDSPFGWLGNWAKGPNGKAGFDWNNYMHVGVYHVNKYSNLWTGTDINPQPQERMAVVRGCGLPKSSLIVRAERVKAALDNGDLDIGHALPFSISITMHGDDPTGKGFFLPPATRLEFANGTNWQGRCVGAITPPNSKCVPQGMIIALEPDFDIEKWADSNGWKGAKRKTAIILANTAKRKGIVLGAETGCGASIIVETDGLLEPKSKKIWESLGIIDTGGNYPSSDILKNLLQRDSKTGRLNYYVVDPPY